MQNGVHLMQNEFIHTNFNTVIIIMIIKIYTFKSEVHASIIKMKRVP